jgi:hypothetical protein
VDQAVPGAERAHSTGHGRRGVAVDIEDRGQPARGDVVEVGADLGGDARGQAAHVAAHVEVDVGLEVERGEVGVGQVRVEVLPGVAQQRPVAPVLQLVVDRALLDDVRLGADEDDMDGVVRVVESRGLGHA